MDTPIYFQAATWTGSTGRPPPPVYSPQRWRASWSTLDRPRRIVHAGLFNPLISAGFRLLPGVYDALVGPLLRVGAMARDRVGPTADRPESRPEHNATRGRWRGL